MPNEFWGYVNQLSHWYIGLSILTMILINLVLFVPLYVISCIGSGDGKIPTRIFAFVCLFAFPLIIFALACIAWIFIIVFQVVIIVFLLWKTAKFIFFFPETIKEKGWKKFLNTLLYPFWVVFSAIFVIHTEIQIWWVQRRMKKKGAEAAAEIKSDAEEAIKNVETNKG
jgi:hypothetical protein